MYKLSIATSYTNPEERMDPWKEALSCYEDLADEVRHPGGSCDSCPAVHLVAEHILLGRKIRPDVVPVIPARCDPVAHGGRSLLWHELALKLSQLHVDCRCVDVPLLVIALAPHDLPTADATRVRGRRGEAWGTAPQGAPAL